jgi:hypothetical protein
MLTVRDWRGTKEGRAALQAFPGKKMRELAALVEPRPGFRDAAARRRFATNVRLWARRWLDQERRHKRRRRPKPTTPALRRDALRKLGGKAASIAKRTAALREQLHKLPDEARDLLATAMDTPSFADGASPFSGLAPEARRWAEGRDMLRALDRSLTRAAGRLVALAAAAERAADLAHEAVRRGAPDRSLGAVIEDLAQIWLDATGRAPTRSWDDDRVERYGPFPDFVYAAIAPLWPGAGSVDGLIDDVCTEFRSRPGN